MIKPRSETPPKKNKTLSWRHIVLIGSLGDESSWALKALAAHQESPEESTIREEMEEQVRRLIARLPGDGPDLIAWKFGLYSEHKTNKAIGKLKGTTKEAVRQRIQVLLKTLRKYAHEEGLLD